jgi:hypothetical protein
VSAYRIVHASLVDHAIAGVSRFVTGEILHVDGSQSTGQ